MDAARRGAGSASVRRAAGGLRGINPYSVAAYVLADQFGGTRDKMAPRFDLDASGNLVQTHAGNSGALAAVKAAGKEGLDFVTEQAALDILKGVGRIVPARARAWVSKRAGALLPSGVRALRDRVAQSFGKTAAGRAIKATHNLVDPITGYSGLFEEIVVEEGMQGAYSALLNLDSEAPNGAGILPLYIRDRNGRSLYTAPEAWLEGFGDVSFDGEPTARDWVIGVARLLNFTGGT
jgi:hypothetical protein